MLSYRLFIYVLAAVFLVLASGNAALRRNPRTSKVIICPSIFVDPSGKGNFTTIQAAINSVPSYNKRWICIRIKSGVYREQITIPFDKPFIYLKGEGKRKTSVVWDAHDSIASSATFTSQADNIMAKSLTFINSYNYPLNGSGKPMRPAVAAVIEGDKSAFFRCGFIGLQDTLWDASGRHYFKLCTIQGAVDFIFGSGQSLYERCSISVVAGALNGVAGYITAQGRSEANETNGFVFKECNIFGNGKTFLGRPWRDYARVLFYNSSMSDIVVPQGWDPWFSTAHLEKLRFAEVDCRGLGSDTSRRVRWANRLAQAELQQLTSISYIDDHDGWLSTFSIIIIRD
ncbi:UNVERIFIED_CONTAM: putative pectinesterase 29 [Sesamum calycinum]|uniref:Pectinesterase n=1 Tax=Sesamum calycinum TaxID=2727403 RepID=A0AAW2RBC8_9LAMI